MRQLLLVLFLLAHSTWTSSLQAQEYEEYGDIHCPTALNTHFNNYQPVRHDGASFWSEWRAELVEQGFPYPLPSYAWYKAYPKSPILSENGGLRWHDARILVHCFATRPSVGVVMLHYHQVDSSGRTEIVRCTSGSGPDPFERDPYGAAYDPYAASAPGDALATDCTGGGMPGTGSGGCQSVFLIIEVSYDGGNTWTSVWEGWGTVCS
jgi:hypothetical protein